MIRWRLLVASALSACAPACSNATLDEPSASLTQGIVAGERSGADQDGVVLLRALQQDQSEVLCTASLVGPNLIMTARHCVANITDGAFSCSVRGELIDNPTGGGELGLTLPAASLEVYAGKPPRESPLAHGQQVVSTLSPTVCVDDLAFVVLDTALDLPVVPMRLGRPAQLHEPTVLVGYGTGANDQLIDYKTQLRKKKTDLEVAAIGPDSLDDVTTVPPRLLIIEGPSGCLGDSGGPLLAQASGAVLGVYSLQRGDSCTAPQVRNQLVHVPSFQALIDEAFAAAGCRPVREPNVGAGGAGGADANGAGGASDSAAAAGGAEASAATVDGGAAGEASVPEPEPRAPSSRRSGCSLAVPGGASDAARLGGLLVLALVAVARRRKTTRRHAV